MYDLTTDEVTETGIYEAEQRAILERRNPKLMMTKNIEIPFGIEQDQENTFLTAYHYRLGELRKMMALSN